MKFENNDCLKIRDLEDQILENVYQQQLTISLFSFEEFGRSVSFNAGLFSTFELFHVLKLISSKNKDLTEIQNFSSKRTKFIFEAFVAGIGLNNILSIEKQGKNEILTMEYTTKENLDILRLAEKSGDPSMKVERTDQSQKLTITGKYTVDKFVDLCEAVLQNQKKVQPSQKINPRTKK